MPSPANHGAMMATLVDAFDGVQRKFIESDEIPQWKRRLGKYFTQNSNGYEEKADKILISLERILDRRTRKNLAHVRAEDKQDVYGILRWMMRENLPGSFPFFEGLWNTRKSETF